MKRNTLPTAVLAVLFVSSAAAQGSTVVSGGGGNLQRAIDAATAGDVLIVRAAAYSQTRVDKGVTILCDAGVVILDVFPTGEALIVGGVPAGQRLSWKGGETGRTSIGPSSTVIRSCAGQVVFEDWETDLLSVASCAQIAISSTTVNRSASVADSAVSMSLSDVGPGSSSSCGSGFCGALTAARSAVELANVRLIGSPGFFTLPPGAALILDASRARITGPSSLLSAGTPSAVPPPSPAIHAIGGRIEIDPRVVLQSAAIPAIQGTATVIQTPIPSVRALGGSTGRTVNIVTEATFGTTFATVMNPLSRITATPFGDLWMALPAYLVDSGTMSAAGQRGVRINVLASAFGQAWTLQSAALTRPGGIVIGPPTVVLFR